MASPRVLRLTFEFHVPEGLKANIRTARIDSAIEKFTAAMQALAGTVFPWADRLTVRQEFAYLWRDHVEPIALPQTEHNTAVEFTSSVPEEL